MIDWHASLQLYGTAQSTLRTRQLIVLVCDNCGKVGTKKCKALGIKPDWLCKSCEVTETNLRRWQDPIYRNKVIAGLSIRTISDQEWHKNYRIEHAAEIKQYRLDNAVKIAYSKAALILRLKSEVLTYYGNGIPCCVLCGEARLGANQIDHINGGGNQHRRLLGRNGSSFYRWLKQQDFPPGYRTLCANCNWREHLKASPLSMSSNNIRLRERRAQIKLGIITILGGVCTECGCNDLSALTIDHPNNDGAEHRREISTGKSGNQFYKALLKSNNFASRPIICKCFSCNDNAAFGRELN